MICARFSLKTDQNIIFAESEILLYQKIVTRNVSIVNQKQNIPRYATFYQIYMFYE